ncbi:hypothetical protein BDV98DRAFT_223224 [Pterulicium gracile]|uniref:Uncharacterized protein n=1 Tax=Pterulicium gracile TaxID=1884261 RepID=A0A5C3QVV2_9AGAR|nr:hypothetical protein BDV98DRAFT_223224 [Pterula gracilis]
MGVVALCFADMGARINDTKDGRDSGREWPMKLLMDFRSLESTVVSCNRLSWGAFRWLTSSRRDSSSWLKSRCKDSRCDSVISSPRWSSEGSKDLRGTMLIRERAGVRDKTCRTLAERIAIRSRWSDFNFVHGMIDTRVSGVISTSWRIR